MDKKLFTAKFKKDYVAYAAIAIFLFIVVAELTLAISIPTYFVHSDLWATNIRRQELFSNFDHLRRIHNNASIKNYEPQNENLLVSWTSNAMANYLRKERNNLTEAQAEELLSEVKALQVIAEKLSSGVGYNYEKNLDFSQAEKFLVQKLTTPTPQK